MSDNMEREKNQSMGAKEIEEEEKQMQRQLEDLGVYETGYSYDYMKEVLGFISESKVMANVANDNKNTQKELNSSSDSTLEPRPSLAQDLEIQEHVDSAKSIHSNRHNHKSPVFDKVPTQSFNSPASVSTFETTHSDTLDKLHNSLIMRDSCPRGSNKHILSRSKNSFQESHNIRSTDMKIINQKMERWRINPLNCCVSDNDVPLQEPDRPVAQDRKLFRLCKEAQTPEMLEKLLPVINAHLKELQELWHSWQHTTNVKFQWGSPIQVGTDNGSLDKNPLTNIQCSQNITDCTGKYTQNRINKRKSALLVSPPDTRHSSDDDEEMKFITTKKKKTQNDKYEPSNMALRSYKNILLEEDLISPNRSRNNKDSTTVEEVSDNLDVNDLQICVDDSPERLSPTLVPKYPRRIVPPNPSTKNVTVPRKRKCDTNMVSKNRLSLNIVEEKQNTVGRNRKKNNTLSDKEICLELEQKDDDNGVKAKQKDVEIKPLKLLNLQVRLEKQCMLLKKEQLEKQKKREAEAKEASKKEEEKKRKREEHLKKQEEETQRRYQQKEEAEKKQIENSMKWNNVLKFKEQKEKARVLRRQEHIRLSETDEENRLLQDNDVSVRRQFETTNNSLTNSVPCPICNKSFPKDEIQTHAAGCEQFVIDDDDDDDDVSYENIVQSKSNIRKKSTSDAVLLECDVCSKYKTTDGIEFEEHVNSCIQRQYESLRTRSYGQTIDVDNIPTSPVRCYRPISQQTDSEIDYRAQFPSNSRSQSTQSRKRKR